MNNQWCPTNPFFGKSPQIVRQEDKMRAIAIAAIVAVASGCLAGDPIGKLATRLNSQIGGLWMNGMQPSFTVASNAPPAEVVGAAAKAWRMVQGTNELAIVEIREVKLTGPLGPPWRAALLKTPSGRKILLFRSQGKDHWWTRFYDVTDDKPNKTSEHISEGRERPSENAQR